MGAGRLQELNRVRARCCIGRYRDTHKVGWAGRATAIFTAGAGESSDGRTAVDNLTVRSVYVIGPDKMIKAMISYPMSTGRNFDEILRLLDSCQLTAKHKVATPANWQNGDNVIIVPAVKDDEAKERFPGGWDAPKPYLRIVPQPKG